MIYVSSSCVRARTIGEAVQLLASEGYRHIELSGGTLPYANLKEDLLRLKKEFGLELLCHNYFPPPEKNFVVNLASLDDEIAQLSMNHLQNAIQLSKEIGARKFGFHAGFLLDIPLVEIGKSIQKKTLFDRKRAMDRFVENLHQLRQHAGELDLYVENNVVSSVNLANYEGVNPFFVTHRSEFTELAERCNVRLLLDVAHLKVSCRSLGLNFDDELNELTDRTDYIHISDNDGLSDNNKAFRADSELYSKLVRKNLKGKTFTLEVYSGLADLRSSFEALNTIM